MVGLVIIDLLKAQTEESFILQSIMEENIFFQKTGLS